MMTSLKLTLRNSGLAAVALLTLPLAAQAQTLLQQWDFDGSSDGLTANGTASFTGTGVSGAVGDGAFVVSNAYTGGVGSGNRASAIDLDIGTLDRFTLTMWVNLTTGDLTQFGRLLSLGNVTPLDNNNPGISLQLNNGNLQFNVNATGQTSNAVNAPTLATQLASNVGSWTFLSFSYDGLSTTAYNSTVNLAAGYGSTNNGAVALGTTTSAAAVVWRPGIATAASSFAVGPGSVALSATDSILSLGNRSDGGRGLTGSMDDVRLYNGILSLAAIDAVRVDALGTIPEPSTYALIIGGLALAGVVYRRRRA